MSNNAYRFTGRVVAVGKTERLVVHVHPAPYGAGVFSPEGFNKALGQFITKWNIAASNACQINEVEAKKKEGGE